MNCILLILVIFFFLFSLGSTVIFFGMVNEHDEEIDSVKAWKKLNENEYKKDL
jgi:flagellar basal body-associated protein FliL